MDLSGIVARLRNRVDTLVARAVISRVNDALKTQRLQLTILDGEVESDVEHLQPYGVSFTPPADAEVLALAVGGDRSHTVAICANSPGARPVGNNTAETGGLYTAGQWRLYIDNAGVVHVGAQSGAEFIALAQKVLTELNAIRTKFDAHIHTTTATIGLGGPGVITVPTSLFGGPAGSVAATKAKAT